MNKTSNSLINRTYNWIYTNIDKFDPSNDYSDNFLIKMLGELQLIIQLAHRNKEFLSEDNKLLLNKILEKTEKYILDPRFYERIQIEPNKFRLYASIVIYYLTYRENKKLEQIIANTSSIAVNLTPELIPYRKMDLENTLQLGSTFLYRENDYKTALGILSEESILNSDLDVLNFGEKEEYAFTHAIFYLTNFGEYKTHINNKINIEEALNILTFKNMLLNDMDLLGEYLICYSCLGVRNETSDLAYKCLVNNQTSFGVTPSPIRSNRIKKRVTDGDPNNIEYVRDNYHTTFVAVIAYLLYNKN